MSFFSFRRDPRRNRGESENASPAALPGPVLAAGQPLMGDLLAQLLAPLQLYLPPVVAGLPAHTVSVVSVEERLVGLGQYRGFEQRGTLGMVALKGGRLDAVVRYQLWGEAPGDVDGALTSLQGALLGAGDTLRAAGFLRLEAADTALPEHVPSLPGWRGHADYRILWEYHYEDTDDAQSLIARIPIHADLEAEDSPDRETAVVTDELVRWDEQRAAPLQIRGRTRIDLLAALAYLPTTPSGSVTLTRTHTGATGDPPLHPDLGTFLDAVAGTEPAQRHARLVFAAFSDFVDAFTPVGGTLPLGDWDEDEVLDEYQPYELRLAAPIHLPATADRLLLTYGGEQFDEIAVFYLHARRG